MALERSARATQILFILAISSMKLLFGNEVRVRQIGHGDDVRWLCVDYMISSIGGNFGCIEIYVGMTPKIIPKLLIWNMILELMMTYDEVNNGHRNGTIHKFGKT
jgi:hypothetical protein